MVKLNDSIVESILTDLSTENYIDDSMVHLDFDELHKLLLKYILFIDIHLLNVKKEHAQKELAMLFKERAMVGLAKYDTTMDRTDLTLSDWFWHLKEELCDSVVYSRKLVKELNSPD